MLEVSEKCRYLHRQDVHSVDIMGKDEVAKHSTSGKRERMERMTVKEAIRLLDPETTRAALAEIEYYGGFRGYDARIKAIEEACEMACDELRKEIGETR